MNTEETRENAKPAVPGASAECRDRLSQIPAEAAAAIERTQQSHAYIRALVLEQAETLDAETKERVTSLMQSFGTESDFEDVEAGFERELDAFVQGFMQRHVGRQSKRGELHSALLVLGDDARRRIKAKLLVEHEDALLRVIDSEFLTFMDFALLDDRCIQKVLRCADQQELAMALKSADFTVQDKVFRNMSRRAGEMLREDMEFMGPVRRKDVYAAQDKILAIMHRLAADGEIVIPRPDPGDEFIY